MKHVAAPTIANYVKYINQQMERMGGNNVSIHTGPLEVETITKLGKYFKLSPEWMGYTKFERLNG